jgi:hypothetical protein
VYVRRLVADDITGKEAFGPLFYLRLFLYQNIFYICAMQPNLYTILAILIALKRSRRNSVIFKRGSTKLAKKLCISPNTLKKYIAIAVKSGYIIEGEDRYEIIPFREILKSISKENKTFYFASHAILRDGRTNVKHIKRVLLRFAVNDMVIRPQVYKIEMKVQELDLINKLTSTGKKQPVLNKHEYQQAKRIIKKGRHNVATAVKLSKSINRNIVTSARHTAKKIGVGITLANKTLNDGATVYDRREECFFLKGANLFNLDKAKSDYPRAKIIPLPYTNSIKVCFGSTLFPRKFGDESVISRFQR